MDPNSLADRCKLHLQSLRLRVRKTLEAIDRAARIKDQALIEQLSFQLQQQRLNLDDYTMTVIASGEEMRANTRLCADIAKNALMRSAVEAAVAQTGAA